MNLEYQGLSGKIYTIAEKKLAGGGEGSIYRLIGNEYQVAKIFKADKRSSGREEKLRYMVRTALSNEQLEEITWPQDVLYDQTGFVGYIMPKLINTSSLTSIYSVGAGNQFDLRHRLLVAINLCHAIQTVHNMGQVCGDLNPQNICVNLDTNDKNHMFHVTLVDTDSYHFHAQGKTYRCEVGLSDYIAPEVQKKMTNGLTLRTAPLPTYTKETDLFALAVHIFTLLMNGCHPFACAKDTNGVLENTMSQMDESFVKDSVTAPQPIENIKYGFFPFYEKRDGITHPVYAPSFDFLPMDLQNLFVRTFVEGYSNPLSRVDTQEWINALMQVKDSLVVCNKNAGHYYFSHKAACGLCDAEERMRRFVEPEPIPPIDFSSESGEGQESEGSEESSETISGHWWEQEKSERQVLFWNILSIILILVIIWVANEGKNRTHYNGTTESVEESATTNVDNPWELAPEVIECPKFGATLQIPEGATVMDAGEYISIDLHESLGQTITIQAESPICYYDSDYDEHNGQKTYTEMPSEKLKRYYKDDYNGEVYTLEECEFMQLGDKWFTKLKYHSDTLKHLKYKTSNNFICYSIEMSFGEEEEYKQDYDVLMEKIAATLMSNKTFIVGDMKLADGTKFELKKDEYCDVYLKREGDPSEEDYDYCIDYYGHGEYEETFISSGKYYGLVQIEDEDDNVVSSYRTEITVPETNNGRKKLNFYIS